MQHTEGVRLLGNNIPCFRTDNRLVREISNSERRKTNMNKQELVNAIATNSGISKKNVEEVLKNFVTVVMDDVAAGNKVQLIGFGTFESTTRAAREMRNPRTGEMSMHPETRNAKFKPSKVFKEKMNA
jgi:DNA-binding protein HU-beta